MMERGWVGGTVVALALALVACGGSGQHQLPDESGDLAVGGGSGEGIGPGLEGTLPAGPELGGTQWKWMEAHCTMGPLDLESRGFKQTARIDADEQGLLLVYDNAFATEACAQTVVQRATPGNDPDTEWRMTEEAHVALPPDCGVAPEEDRPGNIRMRGDFLEVYVQRSNWCNGLEVRMVYAPMDRTPPQSEALVRHYVAHYNRRDVERLASLFADDGSVVEPFTESATGVTRHDGVDAVRAWFEHAIGNVPWVAMRLTSVDKQEGGQLVAEWQYMDPRVEAPFGGKNRFTVAGGEIFETQVELLGEPRLRDESAAEPDEAEGEPGTGAADEGEEDEEAAATGAGGGTARGSGSAS